MYDKNNIKYIDVNGINTRYYECGTGEPLLLLHGGEIGAGSSLDIFSQNFIELEKDFQVFAIDKLGHGYTDNPIKDADFTIECMTNHALKFIHTLGLKNIHLIGQSRGALNGISICLNEPKLIKSFVLCNSASLVPGVGALPAYSKKARAETPYKVGSKEWARYRGEIMSFSSESITDEYVEEWFNIYNLPKSSIARDKMNSFARSQFHSSVEVTKENVFSRISNGELLVPTLIHWGKNDPSALLEPDGLAVFNLLAEYSSKVSMHISNHAGHFAFKEKYVEFNSLVKGFFNSL